MIQIHHFNEAARFELKNEIGGNKKKKLPVLEYFGCLFIISRYNRRGGAKIFVKKGGSLRTVQALNMGVVKLST